MGDLIVLAFEDEAGADGLLAKVGELQHLKLIELDDAATLVRRHDGTVKVKQASDLVGQGALGGAFWGMLIGLLFLVPWLGLAVGAVSGAISGKLTDIGIDDAFIEEVGRTVEPGHSALFLLVRAWTEDRVTGELAPFRAKVLRTSLTHEDEAKLRAAFGGETA